jgi:hypothetical protein
VLKFDVSHLIFSFLSHWWFVGQKDIVIVALTSEIISHYSCFCRKNHLLHFGVIKTIKSWMLHHGFRGVVLLVVSLSIFKRVAKVFVLYKLFCSVPTFSLLRGLRILKNLELVSGLDDFFLTKADFLSMILGFRSIFKVIGHRFELVSNLKVKQLCLIRPI